MESSTSFQCNELLEGQLDAGDHVLGLPEAFSITNSTVDIVGIEWVLHQLGNLYADQGKLAEAEAMYSRALQGYEEALAPILLQTFLPALNTMFNLGGLLSRTYREDKAKIMYTRALVGYITIQGPSSKWCKQLRNRLETL